MFRLSLCLFLLFLSAPAQSASKPYHLTGALHESVLLVIEALFNEDFEKADKVLASFDAKENSQSIVLTTHIFRHWWEMSSQVLENDEAASKTFLEAAEKSLKSAEKKVAADRKDIQALVSIGATLGLMSRWSAANRAWLAAFSRGNKGMNYSQQALQLDDKIQDAYMTIGVFTYAKGKIQAAMAANEKAQVKENDGKPIDGISQIRKAYEGGVYFQKPAGVLLAGILTNENPSEAIPLLRKLREELPKSGFLHMVLITALYNVGAEQALEDEIGDFRKEIAKGTYPKRYETQLYFAKGISDFRKKEWKDSIRSFDEAIDAGSGKNPYFVWSFLYKGYALDAMGKRGEAKRQYKLVLELPRKFSSHDHARDRMEHPFTKTAPELKKLEL